jgi:general secretion pathway protein J
MKGFTLVEMLVALFVFALIGVAGVALINVTTSSQQTLQARTERLGQLQRARAILRADLSQAAPRQTRDIDGARNAAAFAGGQPAQGPFLILVRRGRANPDGLARTSLQYVEYSLSEGRLERRMRSAPDGAALGPPQTLIDQVSEGSAAFLSRGIWGPTFAGVATGLPQAVRLDLDIDGLGRVSQSFVVSGEAS